MRDRAPMLGQVHPSTGASVCVECYPLGLGWSPIHVVHPERAHVCIGCGVEWGGPTTGIDPERFTGPDL